MQCCTGAACRLSKGANISDPTGVFDIMNEEAARLFRRPVISE